MSTEAMKLALEALGLYARTLAPTETQKKGMEAITALDEALAQPQQEPVAWVFRKSLIQKFRWHRDKPVGQEALLYWEPLYTPPPAQEFVCSTGLCHYRKPLTDEEIDAAVKAWFENEIVAGRQPFAKRMRAAIKAAHGIKGDA